MKEIAGTPSEPDDGPTATRLPLTNLERVAGEVKRAATREEVDEQWTELEQMLTAGVHYPWFLRQQ